MMEKIGPVLPGLRVAPLGSGPFQASFELVRGPDTGLFTTEPCNMRVVLPPCRSRYVVSVPLRGGFDVGEQTVQSFKVGEAHVLDDRRVLDLRAWAGMRCLVLSINADRVRSYLRLSGDDGKDFHGRFSASHATGSWVDAAVSLHNSLVGEESARACRIAIGELEDRIVAGLVEARLESDAVGVDKKPTTPRARRAEDYLEANLKTAVSLADLAQACDMPVRSLSRGFRARHGMSPMRFLRIRRLEAAQRELMLGDRETTRVTDVALAYGFWHLGRFAGEFRRHFGEHPSTTLARRPVQNSVRQAA